jgi:hypothetical protein
MRKAKVAKSRGRQGARAARASASGSSGRLWWIGGGAVLALGVVLVVISSGPPEPDLEPAGVQTIEVASASHVETAVAYEQTPPVGGDHFPPPAWQNCGFYSEPIASESAVHSLEHGAVWITHRPDLPEDQIGALRDRTARSYVLVSPWEGELPAPVVASAWGKQLPLQSATDPALAQFIEFYAQGPQTPEPGAACSGGVGNPE